ncbi:MAG: transposase [Magnetococcales bacterium]|nr:transposase [Magnetococcales bacterium]
MICNYYGMYIHIIPNRDSPPAVLLRESYRENGKTKNRTLANLRGLSELQIDRIRRVLRDEPLVPIEQSFQVLRARHHGHVQAVMTAMQRLGMAELIASRPCRERNLVLAMLVARILAPQTKLATTRWLETTSLPEELSIIGASEDSLYDAMDWLLARQERIERKLSARHLSENSLVMFDLSSTYFEGSSCPLAAFGYNRDGKAGKMQVNFGLLTDARSCPVSVSVFNGNTSDVKTLLPQVSRTREKFGIQNLVMVGDRGMITQTHINTFRKTPGLGWITALRSDAIRSLMPEKGFQFGLFDGRNLAEFTHPDFPSERLVACHNQDLANRRARTRLTLLAKTVRRIEPIQRSVATGRLRGQDKIGLRVGRVINRYKMAKHFQLEIGERSLDWRINLTNINAEADLDGIYIVRTNLPADRMDATDTVRSYKRLAKVERAFRSIKEMDLQVRPVHHRLEGRVRAHIFLCMLAYYVKWHMAEAWRPLLFAEEPVNVKPSADPVTTPKRSRVTLDKVQSRRLPDGSTTHSFQTLLADLATITRNTCRTINDLQGAPTFSLDVPPSPKQHQALELLKTIKL